MINTTVFIIIIRLKSDCVSATILREYTSMRVNINVSYSRETGDAVINLEILNFKLVFEILLLFFW